MNFSFRFFSFIGFLIISLNLHGCSDNVDTVDVNEEKWEGELVKSGEFDNTGDHPVKGKIAIHKSSDNKHFLRFESLVVSEGPDVLLYLTKSDSTTEPQGDNSLMIEITGADRGLFIKNGDFNQALPADFDPSMYNGAIVWCKKVGVLFAKATLTSP